MQENGKSTYYKTGKVGEVVTLAFYNTGGIVKTDQSASICIPVTPAIWFHTVIMEEMQLSKGAFIWYKVWSMTYFQVQNPKTHTQGSQYLSHSDCQFG